MSCLASTGDMEAIKINSTRLYQLIQELVLSSRRQVEESKLKILCIESHLEYYVRNIVLLKFSLVN